ncbi:GNAT family N-acetyltransferase [Flavobacterium sedimenticola]|uniref:GNAT family N-acetyltransferase n=1 Tax=Flavobacterium sedimenticola TaxID=3043286 RepID=A0ABT6XRR0_9FLAO|nr:GNAT family N-acetyltransferase [Flavobacterium sedimenticola]MDI9257785.1 GNAT family N-acetyltransferase [Flavobacterium sedimenticola]
MPTILKITAQDTFEVRHPVLRRGKPLESCRFDGDDLATTHHFGLYENHQLKGVISLFEQQNAAFENPNQVQIRGMAVLENQQGKGYGRLLVQHCETVLRQGATDIIWFNARESAVDFYRKLGYEIIGDSFEIPNIGKHYVMWKRLDR